MELNYLLYSLFFGNLFLTNLQIADGSSMGPLQETSNGIWALSARGFGIYFANYDFSEVTDSAWMDTFADTDVAFDPVNGLFIYCEAGFDDECLLHKTSLDKCYDDHFFTIPMQYTYGMVVDSESRLLYCSSLLEPGIYEINIDTGQYRIIFENEENINYLRISSDKRYLYWTQFDFNNPNHIRRGNKDGSGTPITILSRSDEINGFGIDKTVNRIYFTQGNTIYSTDINGNDERTILTETSRVWEMTIENGYLYWGNDDQSFRRISLSGDTSSNTIETLEEVMFDIFVNHRLITASEITMTKSTLSLKTSEFTAYENAESLSIEVIRTGNLYRCSCVDVIVTTGSRRLARATFETTLDFAAADASETFTITWANNDAPDEPDDVTVDLVINSDDIAGDIQTADVVIRDDDCGYFVADENISVNEDIGFVDFVIKRNCSGDISLVTFTQTVFVEATEMDESALGGEDFIPGTIEATFAAGEDTAKARAWLVDNVQPEEPERFALKLVLPKNGLLLSPNEIVVTIIDYDNVYLIDEDKYEVSEADSSVDITIRRIGNTTLPGTVRVAARGQDAKLIEDFHIDPSSEVFHFASGASEVIATISIIDDRILETNETFEVFLHSPVAGSLDDRKSTLVSIIDNEAEVAMSDSQYSCLESHECFVEVVRKGFLEQTTTAHVQTNDLSAFAGRDFVAVDATITFDPWVESIDIQVVLVNDEVKEPHANFITVVDDVSEGLIGEPSQASVALWDDDSALPVLVYSLEHTSYTAMESDGQVEIAILRGGSYLGQTGSVRVRAFRASGDSADVDDFVDPDEVVEFTEGQSRQVFIITIMNDDFVEDLETFTVQLGDVENGALGDEVQATVNIQDEDALYYLQKNTYRVNEVLRELEILVHRIGYLQETGFVTLQITGGNATFDDDYQFSPVGRTLQFTNGETTQSVTIAILDDSIPESTETIDVILSRAQYGTLGNPASAIVYIEDNDIVIESSTAASPSQSRQQIGTYEVVLIVVGIVVVLSMLILLCTAGAIFCYRSQPSSWTFFIPPQRQITAGQPYYSSKLPQNPYANFGHVVRRLSGRVVRRLSNRRYRSPYLNATGPSLYRQPVNAYTSGDQNQLVLYGTTNPMFEGDLYDRGSNLDYRSSVFNRPRMERQLALPPVQRDGYY